MQINAEKSQRRLARSAGEKKEESFPQIAQINAEKNQRKSARISERKMKKVSRRYRRLTQKGISED